MPIEMASSSAERGPSASQLVAIALVSASLFMTELALTRIFSVIMFYHFAFLAISIALFGLSASGVFAYIGRHWLERYTTERLLSTEALIYCAATTAALFGLVRIQVGLTYTPENLARMLTIYGLAALPFFTGGLVLTLAVTRFAPWINRVYAADLSGGAAGCLLLIPLLDVLGAPGVVMSTTVLVLAAAVLFCHARLPRFAALAGALILLLPAGGQISGIAAFDVPETKGHEGDRVLFSKWNSFSRVAVYDRKSPDWALSRAYSGPHPDTRYMDIDSSASTPILNLSPDRSNAEYLRYDLTALAYHLKRPGFTAIVIGPGGGRDLAAALVFGAKHIDAVEINPLIANAVMRGRFLDFSGRIYADPHVTVAVDDGRSYVRHSAAHYDVMQLSLVDTWAATAAGAYTLTENTLYTVEAFNDYLDHLTDSGVLTFTRWVPDGLRLVSLAQAACAGHGWDARDRIVIARQDRAMTFLLKREPFTSAEIETLRRETTRLGFDLLYAPRAGQEPVAPTIDVDVEGTRTGDYARLITTGNHQRFLEAYRQDLTPTSDDRPFFFYTARLKDQFGVAFGRSMLFGNGLSALLSLLGISVVFVALFIVGPLAIGDRGKPRPRAWLAWLTYFGALGAGFMLLEVCLLQRFVLLLGHPVYSLTVTLFSLVLGTAMGSAWSQRFREDRLRRSGMAAVTAVAFIGLIIVGFLSPVIAWAIPFKRAARIAVAGAILVPLGITLGVPMPTGIRLLRARTPQLVTWAWGMNGALSVLGATLAIFIAINWGFRMTLIIASSMYAIGLLALVIATSGSPRA